MSYSTGGFFDNIVHTFQHIVHDVAPVLGEIGATMFGFPPGLGAGVGFLLMKAKAGDPHAKAKIAAMAARDPKLRQFIKTANQHLNRHPDIHKFHAHVARHGGHHHRHPHAAGLILHPEWTHSTGGFFDNIVHTFQHIVHDVAPVLGEIGATMFGFPPGAGGLATILLMKAKAGDPQAKAKVARMSQNPKMRAFLNEAAKHLKAHPHFATFHAHATHPRAHAGPPSMVPSRPLAPHAMQHLTVADHAAGITEHPDWHSAGAIGAQTPGPVARFLDERIETGFGPAMSETVETGRLPHGHHRHRHFGHGIDGDGIDWILGEMTVTDNIPSPVAADGPERWHTHQAPHGTPGM